MRAAPALESESFAVVVPRHYRWTVTRASRGVCFPVTLGEEKPGCLSNRVWLGCDDAVDVLGESDREEAALARGSGLTFLTTEPRRGRKAGEDGGFFALLHVCGFTVSREHKLSVFAFEFAVSQTQARAAINSPKFLTNAHLVATKV